jgi:hypothetical protein
MEIISDYDIEDNALELVDIFNNIYKAISDYRDLKCIQANYREKDNPVYLNTPARYVYRLEKYFEEYPDEYEVFKEDYNISRIMEFKRDVVNVFKNEELESTQILCPICGKKLILNFNLLSCDNCSYCEEFDP